MITTMIIHRPSGRCTKAMDLAKVDNNTTSGYCNYASGHWTQADLDSMNRGNASRSWTVADLNLCDVRHLQCTFEVMEANSRQNITTQIGLSDDTKMSDCGGEVSVICCFCHISFTIFFWFILTLFAFSFHGFLFSPAPLRYMVQFRPLSSISGQVRMKNTAARNGIKDIVWFDEVRADGWTTSNCRTKEEEVPQEAILWVSDFGFLGGRWDSVKC